jgi:predicted branched-subunit amino acid permease
MSVSNIIRVLEPMRSGGRGCKTNEMAGAVPLHTGFIGSQSLPLLAVITLAAVGTAVLLGLAIAAFVRRQSRPYLLIVAALAALLGRSAVAGFTITGVVTPFEHHFLEHGLDVILVALVIAAILHSRTVSQGADSDP